jgi:hypothetical protein
MVHTFQNLKTSDLTLDLEFHQHLGSLKQVINIIMWIRYTGCYKNRRGILSSKRKQERQTQQNTNSRPRINVNSSPAIPIFHPIPQSSQPMPRSTVQGFVTPQQ